MVELNTLLGLPRSFDANSLKIGGRYTIFKDRERAFPLHIAMPVVDSEWNFYGYCVAHSAVVKDQSTQIDFEIVKYPIFQDQILRMLS